MTSPRPICHKSFADLGATVHHAKRALPTRDQIWAIDDIRALGALKDDVELQINQIEAQLEFRDGDEDWANRAVAALGIHRFTNSLIGRRIESLKRRTSPKQGDAIRPDSANSDLTLQALNGLEPIDLSTLTTRADAEYQLDALVCVITAVETDRNDEVALPYADRDEAFLSAANAILKTLRAKRIALTGMIAEFRKADKERRRLEIDRSRERAFVDVARDMLDRATFLSIWAAAERLGLLESRETPTTEAEAHNP